MKSHLKLIPFLGILLVTLVACSLTSAPATPPPATEPPVAESTAIDSAANIVEPTPTLEAVAQSTSTPSTEPTLAQPTTQQVVFTMTSKSLNLRRGPGIFYNVVDIMKAGQSSPVYGRDSTGAWLLVSLPTNPSAFGWVAADPQYSSVTGDLNTVEKKTVPPADPIYIKNCTYHVMQVKPGDYLLSGQTDAPKNMKQVTPGTYTVYDTTANVQVASQALFEGDTLVIYTDGLNNTYACP